MYLIYCFLFAITLAWLNEVPVQKMRDFGASIKEEKSFHAANAIVKLWFVAILNITLIDRLAALLMLWLAFDIVLNFFTDKPMFYVGNTAQLDKLQRKYLGKYAGQIKAAVVVVLILAILFRDAVYIG